ncbi:MAG: hypothetical protein EBT73_02615 [Actinobacteria bacterium]|nr:hypothetical protein [Actinomycetota bacterium]
MAITPRPTATYAASRAIFAAGATVLRRSTFGSVILRGSNERTSNLVRSSERSGLVNCMVGMGVSCAEGVRNTLRRTANFCKHNTCKGMWHVSSVG